MHIVPCSSSRGTWGGTARLLSTVGVTVMLKQPITFSQPFSLTPVPSSRARGVEEKVLRTSLWCLEHWRASLSLSRLSTPLIHGVPSAPASSLLLLPGTLDAGTASTAHTLPLERGSRTVYRTTRERVSRWRSMRSSFQDFSLFRFSQGGVQRSAYTYLQWDFESVHNHTGRSCSEAAFSGARYVAHTAHA